MKSLYKILFIALLVSGLLAKTTNAQGIGINNGGLDPHPSAMLDVDANNKGFLPPRLTTTQRDAIALPATGLVIYNTTTNCINYYDGIGWRERCGSPTYPLISSLDCASATNSGTLTAGAGVSGVSSAIPYTGGNGGPYSAQSISSTGVTGLTATLAAGALASGSGSLTYTITGTPSAAGTASFSLNIGGQSCFLTMTVNSGGPWVSTYVHCGGIPTVVVDVASPATGKTWMDRNLGSTRAATSSIDAQSYGSLFQWGRFADGHQCVNRYSGDGVTTSGTVGTLSISDQPVHGDFIVQPFSPNDWRNPKNDNLWQSVNGVNNPCPSGYRVPTETELNLEKASWSSQDAAGAFASPLKLSMTGIRYGTDGTLGVVDSQGYYWSSTVSTNLSRFFYFSSSANGIFAGNRADGFSVRCIKN